MLTDPELVRRCLDGNHAAFRELHHRHVDRVYRLVGRILGPDADVADVVQDVFIEVHRSLARFRGDAAFSTWLHRLTLHVATSALRRRLRARSPGAPEVPASPPEARLEAREALRALYRLLDALPPKNRLAFVLFELEGLTLEEVADATGAPLHTTAARLRRARIALVRGVAGAPDAVEARRRRAP